MNVNRGKMTAAAVLAVTLLVVGGVTGYGLHRAGTVGQPFVEDGRLKVMASFYPMYDFAHPLSDGIEGISHSICTMEFEDHRPFYDWVVDKVGFEQPPHQYEFARLNVDHILHRDSFPQNR